LLTILPLRSGLNCFLSQNLILLGIFFTLPLYLQIVLGYDALETGIRMLPISITMFVTSASGPALTSRFGARRIVQAGFVLLVVAAFAMLGTIEPELDNVPFSIALAILGVGMGLIASQLGNVVQSSVSDDERGEAGGLQYTAQQLGSSMGTAFIGAIVISALLFAFVDNVSSNERISGELSEAIEVSVSAGGNFVAADEVEAVLVDAGVPEDETAEVVDDYRESQLQSLKIGLLVVAFLAVLSLRFTVNLPGREGEDDELADVPMPVRSA
ncbi:MFS transporter, partial [Ilumatobacter sp.]|uniref:MFS transporter n=1 Tax=Ilumatobacter sp. TaxID=1967498 RepID=UPI003AF9B3A5